MPEIEIITPLDKILFHVFFNISIVTLHCYLCDMSRLLEVDLKIFRIYMYLALQKCDRLKPTVNAVTCKTYFHFISIRQVSVNEQTLLQKLHWVKIMKQRFFLFQFFHVRNQRGLLGASYRNKEFFFPV